jgi:hypothetical protein
VSGLDQLPGKVQANEARASHHEDLLRLGAGAHSDSAPARRGPRGCIPDLKADDIVQMRFKHCKANFGFEWMFLEE